jgi:hypothetical protein
VPGLAHHGVALEDVAERRVGGVPGDRGHGEGAAERLERKVAVTAAVALQCAGETRTEANLPVPTRDHRGRRRTQASHGRAEGCGAVLSLSLSLSLRSSSYFPQIFLFAVDVVSCME